MRFLVDTAIFICDIGIEGTIRLHALEMIEIDCVIYCIPILMTTWSEALLHT